MRISRHPVFTVALLLLVIGLTGCSSTKLTERWKNDRYQGPEANKILVVGMMKDAVTRRFFEQNFVDEAKKMGIDAVASSEYIPGPADHDQREELIALVKQTGAEGVLVAQTKGIDREEGYVPSRLDWQPDGFYNYGFYNYYYRSYRAIHRPGYIGSDKYLRMQIRYFGMKDEQLLWAGNTRTKNPKSLTGTIRAIADQVVSDLRGSGLL